MLKFRIWLDDKRMMVTCADYMIASDGTVYGKGPGYYDVYDLWKLKNAYVMRNTEYVYEKAPDCIYKKGSRCIAQKHIFEFDIVDNCDVLLGAGIDPENVKHLGIIFYDDVEYGFQVYFPYSEVAERLGDLGVDLVSHYFLIKDDPKYKDFVERIPDVIRPDR